MNEIFFPEKKLMDASILHSISVAPLNHQIGNNTYFFIYIINVK